MIAVADGRGCVSLRDLAEHEEDVPVYCINQLSQCVSVEWGRHPRITGACKSLVRIHFETDDDSDTDEYVDVTPDHMCITNDGRVCKASSLHRGDSLPAFTQTRRPALPGGGRHFVTSCVYDNGTQRYKTREQLLARLYCRHTLDDTVSPHAVLEKMDGQSSAWCDEHYFTLQKLAGAIGLELERTVDKDATVIHILRSCEQCNQSFKVPWTRRERSFCSDACVKKKKFAMEERKRAHRTSLHGKMKQTFHKQVDIYETFQAQSSNGCVNKVQWEKECARNGISYLFNRLADNKPWTASSWAEFKDIRANYGKRVLHIEKLPDEHTVYNITVDTHHTIAVVTRRGPVAVRLGGVYMFQCGEY